MLQTTSFMDMEWNTKWDWDNLNVLSSKAVAISSPKKLQSTDWGIKEGVEDFDGSSNLSGVVGGSGGSAYLSASPESSFKGSTDLTIVPVEFVGGELNGTSPSLEASGCTSDHSIGLKLGKRTYFENSFARSNSSVSTVKKVKLSHQSTTIPQCQVEGCNLDLSFSKDYHRKHRVCDMHSKTLKVVVGGLERRFCQQCSRFHALPEFDGKKRSCRKRLADHNARRRKPMQETIQFNAKSLSSSFYDGQELSFAFNNGPLVQTKPAVGPIWKSTCNAKHSVATVKAEKHGGHNGLTHSSGTQFPNQVNIPCTHAFNWIMPSKGTTACVFDQGSNMELLDPHRALSLLSNNSWGSRESGFSGLDHQTIHTNGPSIAQHGIHSAPHGLPLPSPEYWQVDQQSVDLHIHATHFQESHVLKAPYGTQYVNSMDEILKPM